jgi:multicomponent Na+:H+ antiporter subunit F
MIDVALRIALFVYLGTVAVGMIRVVIGPTVVDRMIGLNLVAAQVLAILVLLAVKRDLSVYLDVALVYDIFGFVGMMAITKHFADRERA